MWNGNQHWVFAHHFVSLSVSCSMLHLQDRLLDRHKLLKWMVDKLEAMKTSNEAGQYLYLQLVIKVCFVIS